VNNLPEVQLGYELAAVLQGKGYLVVLDNLESLLDGDGNLESVLWREFLQNWANDGEGSKVLITTREEPNLPKLRFFRYELGDGLEEAEGAAVLRDFGILGTEVELEAVSQRVGGIPLSLMLIVGLLCNDYEEEPHVRFLPDDLFGIEGAHRLGLVTTEAVFRASFDRLESRLQNLLMAVSVFAKPFDRTMAAATLDPRHDTLEDADPYLQVFHHYCELSEYESAFYTIRNGSNVNDIDSFLTLCGYYVKLVELYTRLVNGWQLEQTHWEYTASLTCLGNTYNSLGQYQQGIAFHQQSLEIKKVIGDKKAIGDKNGEARSLTNLANAYHQVGRAKEGFAASFRATQILQELELPLEARPYPNWYKSIIRFSQRGKWQIALCFCIGLFAFPLFLAYLVALLLWRLIKGKVKR